MRRSGWEFHAIMGSQGHPQAQPLRSFLVTCLLGCLVQGAPGAEDQPVVEPLSLPSQIDVAQLTGLVGEYVGVSVQFDPQKLSGMARMDLRQRLGTREAWSVLNQVLLQRGFTTVTAGNPPIYHVVPVNEADGAGQVFTDRTSAEAIDPPPGYVTLVLALRSVSPENATAALTAVLGQKAQIRSLGKDGSRLVLAGDRERVLAASRVLDSIDRTGNAVRFEAYEPRFTSGMKLQVGAVAAWNGAAKVTGRQATIDVQLMPDGQRLLVVSAADEMPGALELLRSLDQPEPTVTRTYRSDHFGIDEVAHLAQQVVGQGEEDARFVRDHLTGGLLVTARERTHERIVALLRDLDAAPPESRQEMRTFVIRHRQATDLASVLRELTANGLGTAGSSTGGAAPPASPVSAAKAAPTPPAGGEPPATAPAHTAGADQPARSGAMDASFTVDSHTNSLIVMGTPRYLERVTAMVERLDRRQPQVEVEVTMVVLSDEDSQTLGVEWARTMTDGDRTFSFSQLFGISQQQGSVVDRTVGGNGFTSLVLNPGNYAAVLKALKTVNHGRNVVTSQAVVDNNAEATINAVLQQPIANISSNTNIATASYGGTSDAGTQIRIKPLIGAADQVQLSFSISQSAFVGESIVTNDGGVVPPPKREDALASVVSVPDGHVIALGGLSNRNTGESRSGVPWLSDIPLVGALFRTSTSTATASRFFLFIRADVLRQTAFDDLKARAVGPAAAAGVDALRRPPLQARFLE